MTRILDRLAREPVLVTGAIRACATLGIAVGLELTPEQLAGLIVGMESMLSMVNRSMVSPS